MSSSVESAQCSSGIAAQSPVNLYWRSESSLY